MLWSQVQWNIPLDAKPNVWYTGVGHHHQKDVVKNRFNDTWCLHLYRYEGELLIDGTPFPIRPGHAGVTAPNVDLEWRLRGPSVHVCALFRFPRSGEARRRAVPIHAMQDLGKDFDALYRALEEGARPFLSHPRRTEARVWDVLWQLVDRPQARKAEMSTPPPLQKAVELIELRLGQPILVGALAREVGVSHNQLTNLFRFHFQATVIGYICERRAQRARQLLLHSTMPIKSIAAEVGIRDLHLFNKTLRRVLGASPRRLRQSGDTGRD